MKRVTLILAALAMIGTAAVVWQSRSLANFQSSPVQPNVESLGPSVAPADPALEQEAASLREQTRELAKLRNEVGQLRAQQSELAAARAENERLVQARQSGAPAPREVPPGFTGKGQLRNAGYETPENAIQTFFWALREGSMELMVQSLNPEHRERRQFEKLPPEKRAELEDDFKREMQQRMMAHFSDFTIVQREQVSADTVVLHIRSSIGPSVAKFRLRQFGLEWKLMDL